MMTNTKLIKNFVKGHVQGEGTNLEIKDNELESHGEIIAFRRGQYVFLNNTNYSKGVSRNQNYLRKVADKLIECHEGRFQILRQRSEQVSQVILAFEVLDNATRMEIR